MRKKKQIDFSSHALALFEHSPVPLLLIGNNAIEFANAAAVARLKYKGRADLIGKSFKEILTPSSFREFQKYSRNGGSHAKLTVPFETVCCDSTTFPATFEISTITLEGVSFSQIALIDISEHKRFTDDIAAVEQVVAALSRTTDLQKLMQITLAKLMEVFGLEVGAFYLLS